MIEDLGVRGNRLTFHVRTSVVPLNALELSSDAARVRSGSATGDDGRPGRVRAVLAWDAYNAFSELIPPGPRDVPAWRYIGIHKFPAHISARYYPGRPEGVSVVGSTDAEGPLSRTSFRLTPLMAMRLHRSCRWLDLLVDVMAARPAFRPALDDGSAVGRLLAQLRFGTMMDWSADRRTEPTQPRPIRYATQMVLAADYGRIRGRPLPGDATPDEDELVAAIEMLARQRFRSFHEFDTERLREWLRATHLAVAPWPLEAIAPRGH